MPTFDGTTTYLGYHWLTDSLGGYLLGLLIARPFWCRSGRPYEGEAR